MGTESTRTGSTLASELGAGQVEVDGLAALLASSAITPAPASDAADKAGAAGDEAASALTSVQQGAPSPGTSQAALVCTKKGTEGKPDVYVVDTPEAVGELVTRLLRGVQTRTRARGLSPSSLSLLYVDLEGVNLGRHGSVSIMQLYLPDLHDIFLLDVHTLKHAAFDSPALGLGTDADESIRGKTLRDVLNGPESELIKVFYDVRADNDALYNLFDIHLDPAAVRDLQLMEIATRQAHDSRNRFVNGLAKSLKADAGLGPAKRDELERVKQAGLRLFAPELGGSYEVFNERPVRDAIVEYCATDVVLLPRLYGEYERKMSKVWEQRVRVEVRTRLGLAKDRFWAKSRQNAFKPTGW